MADNVAITAGSGTTVAADDIAGVMHQRVKLSLGADGTAVDAVAGAGAVGTGVQRVTLASDDPAVTVLGAAADAASATGSIKAALRAIATALGTTALDLGSGTGGSRTLRFFRDTAQWVGGAGAVTSATQRVTLASDDPAVSRLTGPATGTITSVNDAATSTTVLASNSSRKGACFFNDSTSILYLALSNTTASTTVYSVQVPAGGYYELPVGQGGVYTGIVVGIWSADSSGAVRVTELT